MKKTIITSLILTLALACSAQNRPNESANQTLKTDKGINDPKAHAILSDVRTNLKSFKTIRIDFSYYLDDTDKQTGNVLIQGNKYNMHFMGYNLISDGENLWTYSEETKEVQISEVDLSNPDVMNPVALIDNYEKNFRAKLIREDKMDGIDVIIIDLQPFDNRSFHKVRIIVDKAKKMIKATEVHDKNGNIFIYKLDKMTTNVKSSDKDFRFDVSAYPGVEVIDLR